MLTRRLAIQTLAGAAAVASAQAQTKPNLLFLFADDMGWSDVGFNGRKEWNTPNLDRLAAQGTAFDRWYTACPLCAPSRAALMTGKYGIHTTVRGNATDLPASETTIAEALRGQGYTTALIGKWHRGNNLPGGGFTHPLDQGFDTTFGYLDARHAWEHFPKTLWRGREEVPVSGYSSDILADEAIKLFGSAKKPFYLHLAFIEPHFLIEAPEEDLKAYQGKFAEGDASQPYNARYAAMIQRLDKSVGRILKALDDQGLASNTLVVFTSDNGATFEAGNKGTSRFHDSNAPHRGQKRSLEEGGIRVPGCVRWPGRVPAGKRTTAITSTIDILPTFLAAAGGKPDAAWKVDGIDMLDVWTGKAASPPERTLFWEFHTENVDMNAAMRGDFKLLEIGTGQFFLYNVKEDPQERRPLHGENPAMVQRLKSELKDWLATATRPG